MTSRDRLADARERFAEIAEVEGRQRADWQDDLDFSALDQWPEDIRRLREGRPGEAPRPCLVMDQTDQYIRQVENSARQNPPALKARPVDDKADIEVADAITGLYRHIEDASRAQHAYIHALGYAARMGRGFFLVNHDIVDEDRNDQEPRIVKIDNPMGVYFDPHSVEPDGSDAMDAFIVENVERRRFERKYPEVDVTGWSELCNLYGDWYRDDLGVQVATWHTVDYQVERKVELQDGTRISRDEFAELSMSAQAMGITEIPHRTVRAESRVVRVVKMTGHEIIEESVFPSRWIGVIPVYGNVRWTTDGRLVYGMIRAMKDPQRARNYAHSAMIERMALEPKAPWVAPVAAVEGHEDRWERANTSNDSYLPYNHVDRDGNPIATPTRNLGEASFAGWLQVLQISDAAIQGAAGMYNASIGAEGQEKSGRAIIARQREGDISTFHYIDNLSASIQHAGRIILDMIPVLYDHRRVQRILGEDGEASSVVFDPELGQASGEQKGPDDTAIKVMNPTVGRYDVTIGVGPSYSTRRQEAATEMSELVSRMPGLMQVAGDILVRNLDWPGADELAKRLKAMLPPQVLQAEQGSEIPPEVAQIVQQIIGIVQQREQVIAQALKELEGEGADIQKERASLEMQRAQIARERGQLEVLAERLEVRAQRIELDMKGAAQQQVDLIDDAARNLGQQRQAAAAAAGEDEPI